MNPTQKHGYFLVLLAALVCSCGASAAPLRSAPSAPSACSATALAPRTRLQPPATKTEAVRAPGDEREREQGGSERVFVENAERAIGEYSEFIARAGESQEYAPAVKRSREQIEDLQAAIDFVRAGAAQRAANEGALFGALNRIRLCSVNSKNRGLDAFQHATVGA